MLRVCVCPGLDLTEEAGFRANIYIYVHILPRLQQQLRWSVCMDADSRVSEVEFPHVALWLVLLWLWLSTVLCAFTVGAACSPCALCTHLCQIVGHSMHERKRALLDWCVSRSRSSTPEDDSPLGLGRDMPRGRGTTPTSSRHLLEALDSDYESVPSPTPRPSAVTTSPRATVAADRESPVAARRVASALAWRRSAALTGDAGWLAPTVGSILGASTRSQAGGV